MSKQKNTVRRLEDFLTELADADQSIAGWAAAQGFNNHAVYAVVQGRAIGRRGVTRKIIKAMGLPAAAPFGLVKRSISQARATEVAA